MRRHSHNACAKFSSATVGKTLKIVMDRIHRELLFVSTVIPLDETLALSAADIALQESLAMADAIIVAAARAHSCKIITSDSDLKDQPSVVYLPKK